MCDFSSKACVRARRSEIKLVTRDFGTGTRGFAAAIDLALAVCVIAGTELFTGESCVPATGFLGWKTEDNQSGGRQSFDKSTRTERPHIMTRSNFRWADRVADDPVRGSGATVLQLPAQPTTRMKWMPRSAFSTWAEVKGRICAGAQGSGLLSTREH